MLIELCIQNIALIPKLHIPFGPGLNVLTGETGAGKSIVISSVSLALGGRADRDMIRTGCETASVQAVFDISDTPQAMELLSTFGIDPGESVITIARELSANGRNLCRVCGNVVTLTQLRALTFLLMDMHGQHEHQKLLDPATHLLFIDDCGDDAHHSLVAAVSQAYTIWSSAKKALQAANDDIAQSERLADMLRFQIGEIDAVHPKAGEYEQLAEKAKLYEHAEFIAEKIENAYVQTYSGVGRAQSAQESLKKAMNALSSIAEYDVRFSALHERLEECYYMAQDIGLELSSLRDEVEYEPEKLERIQDRIDALKRILRKYGPETENVLSFRSEAAQRLEGIENADERRLELEDALTRADARYAELAKQLTNSREAIADRFCASVRRELSDLGMAKIRFEARFAPKAKLHSPQGTDQLELMIAPNAGEPLKPMASIASGGELARIMLAFKSVQNQERTTNTMVFDEIDTGVSGRMAQAVGEKLSRIGAHKQVICVTHLPQIAALGDQQFLVEKREEEGRTYTIVRKLSPDGRIRELARLVGGAGGEEAAVEHAQQMLSQAQSRKAELR